MNAIKVSDISKSYTEGKTTVSALQNISFDVKDGEKFGKCECKASEKGMICYHLVAGATANIYRQSLKLAK